MKQNSKRDNIIAILGSALLTMVGFTVIFLAAGRFPGQKHLFLDGDFYYEFLHMIKMFLRHLFQGEDLAFSFEVSLGSSTAEVYTGDCMSPFNLLFLLFEDLDTGAYAVTVSKLMAGAAAFAFLLRREVRSDKILTIVFSAAYALGGFSLNFYSDVIFLDGLYVLPILVWAIWRFVRNGRWGVMVFLYAYIFIVQAYIGYIVGIFTAFLFLLFCIEEYGKDKRLWIRSLSRYFISVTTAILLSAVVIVPEAMGIYHYAPSDNTQFEGLQFKIWDLPGILFLGESQGLYNIHPMAYAGVPVLLVIPFFFADRGIEKKKRVLAALVLLFLGICMIWEPAYMFMHGFDNPDSCAFRFSWFLSFVLLFLSAYEIQHGKVNNRKICFVIAFIWCAIYLGLFFLQTACLEEDKRTLSILLLECNAFFLAGYASIFYFSKNSSRRNGLLGVFLAVELVVNGYFILTPDSDNIQRTKAYYDIWQEQAKESLKTIEGLEELDPWEFYRVNYRYAPMLNISMLYGYHGMGAFASQGNENMRNELKQLGYATAVKFVADYGSTPLMRMILAQKYTVYAGKPVGGDINEHYVEKNDETLPLGFMVSDKILQFHADQDNPFENLNNLASAMTGNTVQPYSIYDGSVKVELDGMEIEQTDSYMLIRYTGDGVNVGTAVYRMFPQNAEDEVYAFFSRGGESYNDTASPVVISQKDVGIPDHRPFLMMTRILPVAYNNEEECGEVLIYMYPEGYPEVAYATQYFATVDPQIHSMIFRDLNVNTYRLTEFSDTMIRGNVVAGGDKKILFTSIPCDQGWKAYVDGTECEIQEVMDGAFSALVLEEGEHEVIFKYDVPWFRMGLGFSICGMILLLLFWLKSVYSDRKNMNNKKDDIDELEIKEEDARI